MIEYQALLAPYQPSFIEELHALAVELFGDLDRKELVWRLSEMPHASVHVAREVQLLGFKIGYAVARQRYHSWLGGVRADCRRQGIALQLMEKQHDWLQAQGYTAVETTAVPANTAMLMLNLRVGFRLIGTYHRGDHLRVTMTKELAR